MVYRRTDREMTAYPHEQDFVKLEGVEFRFLTQPVRVLTRDDAVIGLECVRMLLGALDQSDRAMPLPVPGSEFILEADQVVKAIGQHRPSLAQMLNLQTEHGFIKVNENYETSEAGVYAGGDCIRAKGSASTVMAVRDGKLAAQAIQRSLKDAPVGATSHA